MIACLRMKEIPVWYSDVHCASDSLKTSVPVVCMACILQLASNSVIPEVVWCLFTVLTDMCLQVL